MLRSFWYIACAASRLRTAPRQCRVLDQDLVLFRDASGNPNALLDRCCHRGVRLSLGRVLEGTLACGYHGWRYDGTGKCVHIPSLPADRRIPEGALVPAYPCCEQDGYVWVWIGESGIEPGLPMRIAPYEHFRWRQGSVAMRCAAIKGIENNLDWCHPYFAHPWSHGQFFLTRFGGFREQQYEIRLTESGFVVFTPATADGDQPIDPNAVVTLRFDLPDRVTVEFTRPLRFVMVMHFIPTGEASCRLEWMATRLWPLGPCVRWTDREPRILAQDRRLLESAQPWYNGTSADFERSVSADASTLLARRVVALAAEGRWASERPSLPRRRVVTVRA